MVFIGNFKNYQFKVVYQVIKFFFTVFFYGEVEFLLMIKIKGKYYEKNDLERKMKVIGFNVIWKFEKLFCINRY